LKHCTRDGVLREYGDAEFRTVPRCVERQLQVQLCDAISTDGDGSEQSAYDIVVFQRSPAILTSCHARHEPVLEYGYPRADSIAPR